MVIWPVVLLADVVTLRTGEGPRGVAPHGATVHCVAWRGADRKKLKGRVDLQIELVHEKAANVLK